MQDNQTQQTPETQPDFLEKINQRNKNSSNKPLFKVRVKDPNSSKLTLTYFATHVEEQVSVVKFSGYLLSHPNITSYEELIKLAADNGLDEVILTKPWQQVIEIETIRKRK